jgi:steroid delta-isomerase-like uncharacterized protein
MPKTNKELLLDAIACFSDPARRQEYFRLYDPSCVIHGVPGLEPGMEGIKSFYESFWKAFPDAILTALDLLAEGDRAAVRFAVQGTHSAEFNGVPATGRKVTLEGITIFRFRDGRAVERWNQADYLGLMAQLQAD